MKRMLFAMFPLVALLLVAELGVRAVGLVAEPIVPFTLPGEAAGLLELDRDLFWRMKANARVELQAVTVETNALGLRGPAIPEREARELRLLSLGESTTFGNGVAVEDTYSARLERELADALARPVRVINAGVPAWSTFQSVQYLRTRGLALEPDWVLFYHEGNDYLPSYIRASDNTVVGMAQSDRERHADRLRRSHRWLLQWSAVYRFVQNRAALRRIDRFQHAGGTPGERGARWLAQIGDDNVALRFPVRVPAREREALLAELLELAREHRVELLLFHPSYRDTEPHDCALTRFADERGVRVLDVHPLLHAPPATGEAAESLFLDSMHPNAVGHARIARAVLELVVERERER